MNRVESWFKRQQRRNSRFVSIQDMFFGQRKVAYIIYRLKIFNLQAVVRYGFFCFFFLASYGVLSNQTFSFIALIILLQSILASFWWGSLETMRSQIRHEFQAHDEKNLDVSLGYYLYFAIMVTLGFLVVSILAWYYFIYHTDLATVMQWFLLIYVIKLSINLFIRAYHSGAYAVTRIIRTPFSIIAPDIMGILTLAVLYPLFPEYSALAALIARNIIAMTLIVRFVKRMYQFYEFEPIFPSFRKFAKWFKRFPFKQFLLGGLSFLCIQGDIVIVALATYLMQSSLISNEWFLILFLISPMFSATTDWAFLFYFDRKRIKSNDFSKMMDYYNKAVGQSSIVFALVYWIIAMFAVATLISAQACQYLLILLPFFIIKAKLADMQIKRFSYNGYLDVILASVFMLAIIVFAFKMGFLLLNYFLVLLSFVIAIKILEKPRFKKIRDPKLYKLPVSLYTFLDKLTNAVSHQLTTYYITAADNIHVHQQFYILDKLSESFVQKNEELCAIDDTHYLFFTLDRELSRYEIIEAISGLVKTVEKKKILCPAHLKFLLHNRHDIFSRFLPKTFLRSHTKLSHDDIKKRFFDSFPSGICHDPEPELGQAAKLMSLEDTRALYIQTIQYLFHTRNERFSHYETTVCYSNGRIEYVFSVPKSSSHVADLRRWQHFIHDQNIIHATTD